MNPDVSASVKELLEDLDLYRLPVVPKEVCRRLGIEYREYRYEGMEGTLLVMGDQQLIGVNANTKEASRRAFTCAHEIGHYYFDLSDGKTCSSCSADDVAEHVAHNPRELRANAFAAELLMPRGLVEPLIRSSVPSWEYITKLANECGASIQAAAQKYVQLASHTCWIAVLNEGKVARYNKSDSTQFHLKTKHTFIVPRGASAEWQAVSALCWMGRGRHTRRRKLSQSFLPKNQYGDTLALVWDRENHFGGQVQNKATLSEKLLFAVFGCAVFLYLGQFATDFLRAKIKQETHRISGVRKNGRK